MVSTFLFVSAALAGKLTVVWSIMGQDNAFQSTSLVSVASGDVRGGSHTLLCGTLDSKRTCALQDAAKKEVARTTDISGGGDAGWRIHFANGTGDGPLTIELK